MIPILISLYPHQVPLNPGRSPISKSAKSASKSRTTAGPLLDLWSHRFFHAILTACFIRVALSRPQDARSSFCRNPGGSNVLGRVCSWLLNIGRVYSRWPAKNDSASTSASCSIFNDPTDSKLILLTVGAESWIPSNSIHHRLVWAFAIWQKPSGDFPNTSPWFFDGPNRNRCFTYYMGLSENRVNLPNEIAIFHRDDDQQNHWV